MLHAKRKPQEIHCGSVHDENVKTMKGFLLIPAAQRLPADDRFYMQKSVFIFSPRFC